MALMQSAEIWDHEQLLLSLGVMKQIMPKLINTFLMQTSNVLDTIEIQSDSQLQLTAHSLKGSAGQLFCPRLTITAAQLEQELKQQLSLDTNERRRVLVAEIHAVRQIMQDYILQNS